VDKVLNGSLEQMEEAIEKMKSRLIDSNDAYGFFFYAGHGVQSNGSNFLIPVDVNIQNESQLRTRSVSVQDTLYEMNSAGNDLNVMVLDACRDNPFGWSRSGLRGLAMVSAPAGSIVVYATSANAAANDGTGKNGLFTGELLKHLPAPGLSVQEIFNKTGQDVTRVSGGRQYPEISVRHFSADSLYLGSPPFTMSKGAVSTATGALLINTVTAGTIQLIGAQVNESFALPEWGSLPFDEISAGTYQVIMRYEDGKTEEKSVEIGRAELKKLDFSYKPPAPKPLPPPKEPRPLKPPPPPKEPPPPREPKPPKETQPAREKTETGDTHLNTLGFSLGTSTMRPLFITTLQGTIAPSKYTFFRLGMDLGLGLMWDPPMLVPEFGSEPEPEPDTEYSYLKDISLYPFAHYSLFLPFNGKGGWHIGAGGGLMIANYNYTDIDKKYTDVFGAFELATGFNLRNVIDISYNLRLRSGKANSKFSLGYTYRFK
jgi:hypothetical protein